MKPSFVRLLVGLSAAHAVPAGLIYWFWREVEKHPFGTILFLACFEILLWVCVLLSDVWRIYIKDRVEKHIADAIIIFLGRVLNIWKFSTPTFYKRYRRLLFQVYDLINTRGLGLINAKRLELHKVFVALHLQTPSSEDDPFAILPNPPQNSENIEIWDILRNSKDGMGWAIVGAPGSGKTTLLHHVLLIFLKNKQWTSHFRMRARLPIFLPLREISNIVLQDEKQSLGNVTETYLRQQYAALNPPPDWFEKRLKKGKCIVLLDGLDEISDLDSRERIVHWLDAQVLAYAGCAFLLTARPGGYRSLPPQQFHKLTVLNLSPHQVNAFIHNWYQADEIMSSANVVSKMITDRAQYRADELLLRLSKVPALNQLTTNPLLLTMIVMVHRYRGSLPGSRYELYQEICQVLLDRWRSVKGIVESLKGEQKLAALRTIATQMMNQHAVTISSEKAFQLIQPLLLRFALDDNKQTQFLNDIQDSSGLFHEKETDCWGFAHKTFQEYLTALGWKSDRMPPANWAAFVSDDWWAETIRLYAAQCDATPIVQACLSNQSMTSLSLAWDLLEESFAIETKVRADAEASLVLALNSKDAQQWPIAVAVTLERRLISGFIDINGIQGDTSLITCSEYQLFIDAMKNSAKQHFHPDHWASTSFPAKTGRNSVGGIRSNDAEAFCAWLTEHSGGSLWRYRLPTCAEFALIDEKFLRGQPIWCSQEETNFRLMYRDPSSIQSLIEAVKKSMPTDIIYQESKLQTSLANLSDYLRDLITTDGTHFFVNRSLGLTDERLLYQRFEDTLEIFLDHTLMLDINFPRNISRLLHFHAFPNLALTRYLVSAISNSLPATFTLNFARQTASRITAEIDAFIDGFTNHPEHPQMSKHVFDRYLIHDETLPDEMLRIHIEETKSSSDSKEVYNKVGRWLGDFLAEVKKKVGALKPINYRRILLAQSLHNVFEQLPLASSLAAKHKFYANKCAIAASSDQATWLLVRQDIDSLSKPHSNITTTEQWIRLHWLFQLTITCIKKPSLAVGGLFLIREASRYAKGNEWRPTAHLQ